MAKKLFRPKKWFVTPASTSTMEPDRFVPSRDPPIKKQRSFFHLTFNSSRTSSLHNGTPGSSSCGLQQLDETNDDNLGRETVSRTIYYNAPRHQQSIGNLTAASISAPDVSVSNTSRQGDPILHQPASRPPPSTLAERLRQSRWRSSSISTEYLTDHMQHCSHTPHFRPEHSLESRRLPSSSHAPAIQSPLSGAIGSNSATSSSFSNWRPPVPSKDDEPSHYEYGLMMRVLDDLAGSVDDLSRKMSTLMALAGTPENLATRLVFRTRRRTSSEPGNRDDLTFTDEIPSITQQNCKAAQPPHAAATIGVSPLGCSAVYRPPTPPRPRP